MKSKKKYIVFASLVLALSAAVYINWQLSGAKTPKSAKELGAASYVSATAIFQPKGQSGRQLRIK